MAATSTTASTAAPFTFPSDFRSSFAHWWSVGKTHGEEAEIGLVKRGLGTIPLLQPSELGTASPANKVAVFRDLPVQAPAKASASERKRWYLHFLEVGTPVKEPGEYTTIVTHGYGNGLSFWFQNLQTLTSPPNTRTFFLDWLGMGRSGRPSFPSICTNDESPSGIEKRVSLAEAFFVDSLEEFRAKMGVEKLVLVGHSIGGYLSAAYALKHPERVSKLILISPVGVPLSPYGPAKQKAGNGKVKTDREEADEIATALEGQMLPSGDVSEEAPNNLPPAPKTWWTWAWEKNFSPFGVLRSTTFMGPSLLSRYASRRFATFPESTQSDLFDYLYHISTARGSGEYCLAHLLAPGAYARSPLLKRLDKLDVPITFIYGDHDWMDEKGGYEVVKKLKAKPVTEQSARQQKESKVLINEHSGHWVHLENPKGFNRMIEKELKDAHA